MQTITPEELKQRMDAGEKLNIVDVREPHEHQAFNIGGFQFCGGLVQAFGIAAVYYYQATRLAERKRAGPANSGTGAGYYYYFVFHGKT